MPTYHGFWYQHDKSLGEEGEQIIVVHYAIKNQLEHRSPPTTSETMPNITP